MSGVVQDFEDPDASVTKEKDSNGNDVGSDSEDEAAPDFSQLTALANRAKAKEGLLQDDSHQNSQFIPKRGEKDFEPTGFTGQKNALENSRKAMFDVIASERIINSKSISIATWHPELQRAIVHLVKGQTFASMGVAKRVPVLEDGQYQDLAQIYGGQTKAPVAGTMKDGIFWPKLQSRLELLPEEALYLVDRGSLECRILDQRAQHSASSIRSGTEFREYDDISDDSTWAPMSVEQAFATIIGADGLTRQHYQLYAYLRRLGYIVQRKSISDELRKISKANNQASKENVVEAEGVIADPRHPLRLLTIFDVMFYPLRRILQLTSNGLTYIRRLLGNLLQWWRDRTRQVTSSSKKKDPSMLSRPGLLGIGMTSWSSYDDIYDKLRIIPSGHDVALPKPAVALEQDVAPEIFFYSWRPATHFKKSDPPLPEFQLAVVDARSTSLPSAFAFGDVFEHIPMPLSTQEWEEMDEEEQRVWRMAEEQKKRNNESYGKGAVRKAQAEAKAAKEAKELMSKRKPSFVSNTLQRFIGLLQFLAKLFAHLPPGCRTQYKSKSRQNRQFGRKSSVNVYVPLKAGRRNVIVAVNDCGTTSLLRFGEAEFARWRIAGTHREGH